MKDTDRSPRAKAKDTFFVNLLYIEVIFATGPEPLAPSDLSSTVTDGNVELTWVDNSSDEDGFYIERSLDGESWSRIGEVVADVVEFIDSNGV